MKQLSGSTECVALGGFRCLLRDFSAAKEQKHATERKQRRANQRFSQAL